MNLMDSYWPEITGNDLWIIADGDGNVHVDLSQRDNGVFNAYSYITAHADDQVIEVCHCVAEIFDLPHYKSGDDLPNSDKILSHFYRISDEQSLVLNDELIYKYANDTRVALVTQLDIHPQIHSTQLPFALLRATSNLLNRFMLADVMTLLPSRIIKPEPKLCQEWGVLPLLGDDGYLLSAKFRDFDIGNIPLHRKDKT